jgi:hypothetical protein
MSLDARPKGLLAPAPFAKQRKHFHFFVQHIITISQAAYLQKRLTVLLIEAMHLSNRNFRCASPAFLLGQVRTRADVDASSNISPQCQGKYRENLRFKSKMSFSGYP